MKITEFAYQISKIKISDKMDIYGDSPLVQSAKYGKGVRGLQGVYLINSMLPGFWPFQLQ